MVSAQSRYIVPPDTGDCNAVLAGLAATPALLPRGSKLIAPEFRMLDVEIASIIINPQKRAAM